MWRPRDRERFIGSYDPEHEMPDPDRGPGDRWQSDAYRHGARDSRYAYRFNPDRVERGYDGPRRDTSRDIGSRWRGDARDRDFGGRPAPGGGQWDRDRDYDRPGGYDRGGYGGGGYDTYGRGYEGGSGGYGGGYGGGGYDRDRGGPDRWGGDDRSFDRGWNRDFDRDRDFDRGGFMTGPRFDRDHNFGSDRGWDHDRDGWDRGYEDWRRDWRRR